MIKTTFTLNVIHDGVPFNRGDECPPALVKLFSERGLLKEVHIAEPTPSPAAPMPKVEAAPEVKEAKAKPKKG